MLLYIFLDRYVLLGNHRDSWVFGAVDPSSGTASMMELARVLGKLRKEGSVFIFYIYSSKQLKFQCNFWMNFWICNTIFFLIENNNIQNIFIFFGAISFSEHLVRSTFICKNTVVHLATLPTYHTTFLHKMNSQNSPDILKSYNSIKHILRFINLDIK